MVATASLMERSEPYDLCRELARGTLNRARNFVSDLQQAGYSVPEQVRDDIRQQTVELSQLVTGATVGEESQDRYAHAIVDQTLAIMARLVDSYTQQALDVRMADQSPLPTLCLGQLESVPDSAEAERAFLQAFNSVAITVRWRDVALDENRYDWQRVDAVVDWAHAHQLKVCMGPLHRCSRHVFLTGFTSGRMISTVCRKALAGFLDQVVRRYHGRVHIWDCAGGVNLPGAMSLPEEERLRLAVLSIETVRQASPRTPLILRFDQPWAEYLLRSDLELSPLHFADALIRSQVGAGRNRAGSELWRRPRADPAAR